jgi:cytochrome c-type biogenesis protein
MSNSSLSLAIRITLVTVATFLFFITVLGLIWLAGAGTGISLALSYAAGLSMIFLPCTLPLVFVIVPLTMGEKPQKGFLMAILFGVGLTLTLTLYGIVISQLGEYLGLNSATRIMFIVAGSAALIFGWSELHLFTMELPMIGSAPQWVYRQKDYIKSFFLGFFLGNAGIGCPNPAFYVLLVYIATTGSILTGASLGFVHGLGRATPLILFAILGILGVSAVAWTQKNAPKVREWTAWALIVIGGFIFTKGLLGMEWWEDAIIHQKWNQFILEKVPALAEKAGHPVSEGFIEAPFWMGWVIMLALPLLTMIWYQIRYGISRKVWSTVAVLYVFLLMMLGTGKSEGEEHGHSDDGGEHVEGDVHAPDEH